MIKAIGIPRRPEPLTSGYSRISNSGIHDGALRVQTLVAHERHRTPSPTPHHVLRQSGDVALLKTWTPEVSIPVSPTASSIALTATEIVPEGDKWGITKADLRKLKKMVLKHSDKLYEKSDDPKDPKDPCVHVVMEHLIKPKLKRGESWALKQHPDGLEVDCFATHSWDEGIFEFIDKALDVFPLCAKGMYVCFLSNPQDAVEALLNVPLEQTPFAKALQASTYLLVLPNSKICIYERLWCVYEMNLAYEKCKFESSNIRVKLPWHRGIQTLVCRCMLVYCLAIPGFILAYFFLAKHIGYWFGPLMWLLVSHMVGTCGWMTIEAVGCCLLGCKDIREDTHWHDLLIEMWVYCRVLLTGFFAGLSWFDL
jgi:hypothetical protein